MIHSLTNLAITQAWQLTLLVLIAGLLHRLFADRAPRLMLMLWVLVAVKAVTPPLVSSPAGLFSWMQASSIGHRPNEIGLMAVDWTPASSFVTILLFAGVVVWLLGSFCLLALTVWRSRQLGALMDRDTLPASDPLSEYTRQLADLHGLKSPSRLVVSQDELGPAVAGVFRPTVILPASLVRQSEPDTLCPVLLHELVHTSRRDTAIALLHTINRVVWWFHPAVWWATQQAESLVERCVDLTVVRDLQTSLGDYGGGLLRVLELRAELQPRPELASLRPCQITTERLNFLRALKDMSPASDPARSLRRVAFIALAAIVLPALPVDALAPRCSPSLVPSLGETTTAPTNRMAATAGSSHQSR